MDAFNDPRVKRIDLYFYIVQTDDKYDVSAFTNPQEWWVRPSIDSIAMREAGLRDRQDAERWLLDVQRGPFRTAEQALKEALS